MMFYVLRIFRRLKLAATENEQKQGGERLYGKIMGRHMGLPYRYGKTISKAESLACFILLWCFVLYALCSLPYALCCP